MILKAIEVLNTLKFRFKEKLRRLNAAILIQRQWGWFKYRCRYSILQHHHVNFIIIVFLVTWSK